MSGISALRDRTLSWSVRLEKANQMLTNSASLPYIPRREQVLIDWLLFAIHSSSSKSVGEVWTTQETRSAWILLANIFDSGEIKRLSEAGESILIPLRFYDDVMTALTGSDIDTSRQVLSCLKSLSTLPCFKTFSYLSIETLVKLVSSCCHFAERSDTLTQLYTNYICCDSGDADKCCRSTSCAAALLLSTCITVLLERISQQAKGRSLSLPILLKIAKSLLGSHVLANPVFTNLSENRSSPVGSLLTKATLDLLINKSTIKHFDKHIKIKSAEIPKCNGKRKSADDSTPAAKRGSAAITHVTKEKPGDGNVVEHLNFVGVIFSVLEAGIKDANSGMVNAYIDVMANLLEKFLISSSAVQGSRQATGVNRFGFFYFLVNLAENMEVEKVVSAWSRLLKLAVSHEVHNPTSDTSVKECASLNRMLSLLLTEYAIPHDGVGDDECILYLLKCNHRCVDRQLKRVLDAVWQSQHSHKSPLLSSLLETYHKMRQLPKLIGIMADSVLSFPQPCHLANEALESLKEVISTSPVPVCLEIWQSLYTKICESMDSATVTQCLVLCDILSSIMRHMKVYDSTVPLNSKRKLITQLLAMQTYLSDCLTSWESSVVSERHCLVATLVDSCVAIAIVLYRYVTTEQVEEDFLRPAILLVDKTIECSPSVESHQLLNKYIQVKLNSHRIALRELLSDNVEFEQTLPSLSAILDIWNSVSTSSAYRNTAFSSLLGISSDNAATLLFSHVTTSSLVMPLSLSPSHTTEFVKLLLDVTLFSEKLLFLEKVTHFFGSWKFTELPVLFHESLVVEITTRLCSVLSLQQPSSQKKEKKGKAKAKDIFPSPPLLEYFACLGDCVKPGEKKTETTSPNLQRLYEKTTGILSEFSPHPSTQQVDAIVRCVRVLESVAASRNIWSTSVASVFPSLFAVLLKCLHTALLHHSITTSGTNNWEKEAVVNTKISLLKLLVMSVNSDLSTRFLQCVGLEDVITFLASVTPLEGFSEDVLLEGLTQTVNRGDDHVVNSAVHFLSKVYEALKSDFLSRKNESTNLQYKFFFRVVFSALKPHPRNSAVQKSLNSWVTETTKDLCETVAAVKVAVSELFSSNSSLTNELLVWLSLSSHAAGRKISAITEFIVDDLKLIVSHEKEWNRKRAESMLTYLKNVLQLSSHSSTSTQSNKSVTHKSTRCPPSLLFPLWKVVTSLSALADDSSMHRHLSDLVHCLVVSTDETTLLSYLNHLHSLVTDQVLTCSTIHSFIQMWVCLLGCDTPSKSVIETHSRQLMTECQGYISWLSDGLTETLQKRLLVDLLSLMASILAKGKTYCDSQGISAVISGIHLCLPSKQVYHVDELIQPLSAIQKILAAMLLHHQLSANHNLAIFASVITKFVEIIIMFSVQGLDVDKEIHHVEKELICCCQQLQKVISLMSGYPQIFGKVSSFILSDVVHSLKSVTLLPNVKKYLYSALNGLFDLLDEFSSIMLKTNLKEAEREIFKAIYSQWEKYHKYTGKV